MSPNGDARVWSGPLLGAAIFSGAAALIYETLWTRSFAIILGSTVEAAAATFAAFLVGLSLGAYGAGRVSSSARRIAAFYVATEVGVALTAATCGLLLHLGRDELPRSVAGILAAARAGGAFGMVVAFVILPTLLMGATFPFLVAVARRRIRSRQIIGRLYAVNTLGAALGTVACGVVLIPQLGTLNALWAAAAMNLLSGLLVLPEALGSAPDPAPSVAAAPTAEETGPASVPHGLLLLVATASGLMILALEVAWTRLASFFLGNRIYAFTILLACLLGLLSAGAAVAEWLWGRLRGRVLPLLGALLTLSAVGVSLSASVADGWIAVQDALEPSLPLVGHLLPLYRILETALLLVPSFGPLACLFPLCLMESRLSEREAGRAAGLFYLVNTVGSAAGSLGTGFWAMAAIGAYGCLAMVSLLAAGLGALLFLSWARQGGGRRGFAGAVAALGLAGASLAVSPGALTYLRTGEKLLVRVEDAHGVFQLSRLPSGAIRSSNNRTDLAFILGGFSTSYVQQMQGHLGVFFSPSARRAAVLGSGYGITAGALGAYPQMERVDAVEIIPAMVDAAPLFEPFNFAYQRNPRVRVIVDDGRHFLARGDEKYDIVTINVSDPHLPGGSSLFHLDFYDVVKRHLTDQGVVVQHAFGHDVRIVLVTLAKAFPYVRLFPSYSNGYNVVAATHPLEPDPAGLARATEAPAVRAMLTEIGLGEPLSLPGFLRRSYRPQDLPDLFRETRIASDEHPYLEFAFSGSQSLLFSNE